MFDMLDLEIIAIKLEYFSKVTITVLCHQIDLFEIVKILRFWDYHIQKLHNIWMLAVFQ